MNQPSKSNFDQELAQLRDAIPAIWWAVYTGCVEKGFTPDQALQLTIAFLQKPSE